jgi:YD repeat-containing protein
MLPEAKSDNLLYVADGLTPDGYVHVYSYPKGKRVGQITGLSAPYGDCADKAGNVWVITNLPPEAVEYAHGGTTPIATLSVPAGSYAFACAVDPTTGNLAVTQDGGVSIYVDAQGTPTTYTDWAEPMRCTYDDSGNLFANTSDELTELPSGSGAFVIVNFSKNETGLSNVLWDGKYLAVEGRPGAGKKGAPAPVYRVSVSGNTATIIHTLTLEVPRQTPDITGSWIADHLIAQPVDRGKHVAIWAYPEGGNPLTLIPMTGRDVRGTVAATVSLAH